MVYIVKISSYKIIDQSLRKICVLGNLKDRPYMGLVKPLGLLGLEAARISRQTAY
jgi:hypothetical protein